jgi:hypothetical protein
MNPDGPQEKVVWEEDNPGDVEPRHWMNDLSFHFTLSVEKIPHEGEDGPPLYVPSSSDVVWLGVFDGVGGAGKKRHAVQGQRQWTEARIASHVVSSALVDWLSSPTVGEYLAGRSLGPAIRECVEHSLGATNESFRRHEPTSRPVITGTAIKAFPTTMALARVEQRPGEVDVRVLWAGDSRIYCLSPEGGMQQLTEDHVRKADPSCHHAADRPMTNMLSAGAPFHVAERAVTHDVPVIVFAATDGCFEYFRYPVGFEQAVLETMQHARDATSWHEALAVTLNDVASDDCTMSLLAVGWDSFESMQQEFAARWTDVNRRMGEIEAARQRIDDVSKRRDEELRRLQEELLALADERSPGHRARHIIHEEWSSGAP